MREIRFRAWNKKLNIMRYTLHNSDILPKSIMSTDGVSYSRDCNVLMQSTGLKDKNGVEIYEGDIISVFDYDTEFLGHGKIVFDNFSWCIEWICEDKNFTMMFSEWYEETKTVEVIGNIYENPELLELANE